MRKVLLGGTSAIALAIAMAGLASAADIATMDPVIEAPIIEEEAFSWTGLYIGGHGGYGFANFEGIVDGTDSSAATADGLDLSGIAAGGHIGFNYQIRNVVVGIEADATWTDWSDTQPAAGSSSSGIDGSVDLLASVRGRLGLAMDNGLVYVTGGAAWAPEAEAENFHSDSHHRDGRLRRYRRGVRRRCRVGADRLVHPSRRGPLLHVQRQEHRA